MTYKQIDCFSINTKFWKFLGVWPGNIAFHYYNYYKHIFKIIFFYLYIILPTINFYFLPRNMDTIIEETMFYFTEINVLSKVLTLIWYREKFLLILETLECDTFQPQTEYGRELIAKSKKSIVTFWKIVAVTSATSNGSHVLSPFIIHLLFPVKLQLPLCSYSFIGDELKDKLIYPLYFYQCIGMHFCMWINVNTDTFILGIIVLVITQLEILSENLRNITTNVNNNNEEESIRNLNKGIIHFDKIIRFCSLVEEVFSISLFIQFGIASCLLCVCLFRFTLPAPMQYYIFLTTYIFIMTIQILVPCWFGTQIMSKSVLLSEAVYDCDWTPRSKKFKSSLRLFVERANKPLSITGGKMFPLSLTTFTSIMNSAYSFFTLLRHMQSREN